MATNVPEFGPGPCATRLLGDCQAAGGLQGPRSGPGHLADKILCSPRGRRAFYEPYTGA